MNNIQYIFFFTVLLLDKKIASSTVILRFIFITKTEQTYLESTIFQFIQTTEKWHPVADTYKVILVK